MHFLIQTIEGRIKHDFSFTLLEAIRYQNWYRDEVFCTFDLFEDIPSFTQGAVPVGSVEFVSFYLEKYFNKKPAPRNIPESIIPFAGRWVVNGNENDLIESCFVKSNNQIKGFTGLIENPSFLLPPGKYQFSDIIDIQSEWRSFVYQKKLVGLQNYSGDFVMFPDVNTINHIIQEFEMNDAPDAYTLDVGVNQDNGTFVVEVHDFFSCGLYGFSDLRILPFMFTDWFYSFVKSTKK